MPAGLQTWDAQGRQELDLSSRAPRIFGSVTLSGQSGQVALPLPSDGSTPFIIQATFPSAGSGRFGACMSLLAWSFNGHTLVWSYTTGFNLSSISITVFYGSY
jgi:hypothetical protein